MDFDSILEYLLLIGGVLLLLSRILDWRSFVRMHAPVQYAHQGSLEAWRWAKPPPEVALQVVNTSHSSGLILPDKRSSNQKVALIIGALLILLGLSHLLGVVIPKPDGSRSGEGVIFGPIILLLGAGMLHFDSRLIGIDLHPDRAVFVLRFGYYFKRSITKKAGSVRSVSGKVQSVLSQDKDQRKPYYYVTVNCWPLSKQFVTNCDPSQGSWVVGGLEYWRSAVQKT